MEFLIIVDAQNDLINGKLAVPGANEAVSYTHLDVYKRQRQRSFLRQMPHAQYLPQPPLQW